MYFVNVRHATNSNPAPLASVRPRPAIAASGDVRIQRSSNPPIHAVSSATSATPTITVKTPARSPGGGDGPTSVSPNTNSATAANTMTVIRPAVSTNGSLSPSQGATPIFHSQGTPWNTTASEPRTYTAPSRLARVRFPAEVRVWLSGVFFIATAMAMSYFPEQA